MLVPLPPGSAPSNTSPPVSQPAIAPSVPTSVTITARALVFDRTSITLRAGVQVTLTMVNTDQGVPHDIAVSVPSAAKTDYCAGPCTQTLSFVATPGRYTFVCSLHPDMTGTLIAQ